MVQLAAHNRPDYPRPLNADAEPVDKRRIHCLTKCAFMLMHYTVFSTLM